MPPGSLKCSKYFQFFHFSIFFFTLVFLFSCVLAYYESYRLTCCCDLQFFLTKYGHLKDNNVNFQILYLLIYLYFIEF